MNVVKFGSAKSRLIALERDIAKRDAFAGSIGNGLADRLKAARLRAAAPGFVHMTPDESLAAGHRIRALLAAERSRGGR